MNLKKWFVKEWPYLRVGTLILGSMLLGYLWAVAFFDVPPMSEFAGWVDYLRAPIGQLGGMRITLAGAVFLPPVVLAFPLIILFLALDFHKELRETDDGESDEGESFSIKEQFAAFKWLFKKESLFFWRIMIILYGCIFLGYYWAIHWFHVPPMSAFDGYSDYFTSTIGYIFGREVSLMGAAFVTPFVIGLPLNILFMVTDLLKSMREEREIDGDK